MSWQKSLLNYKRVLLILIAFTVSACGVKGDPLPPERPTQLGRGRPTYRRATEGIKLQKHHKSDDDENEEEDKEDEESE